MRSLFFGVILSFICFFALGQRSLTMQECVAITLKNNIQLKQVDNTKLAAELSRKLAVMDFLPNLNLSANYSWGFGTNFDFNTFQRVQNVTSSSSPNISSTITLFDGLQRYYSLKKADVDITATEHSKESLERTLTTNVILAYFQVVFSKENLTIAEDRVVLIKQQLDRVKKQFKGGVMTEGDVQNLSSQLASETMNVVNQQNLYKRNILTLTQLLEIDPFAEYELVVPQVEEAMLEEEEYNLQNILDYALYNMPEMKEKKLRIVSAEYQTKVAKAALYPTLSMSGGFRSNYSSNGIFDPVEGLKKVSFFKQMDDNASQSLTFSLNVPIFNNLRARGNFQRQQITEQNAYLDLQNQQKALTQAIQQAWLDVTSARSKLQAGKEQLKALDESFKSAKIRFDAGVIDFVTYSEMLNNKTKAEADLLQAKYDFLLKKKILDFYQGRPISF